MRIEPNILFLRHSVEAKLRRLHSNLRIAKGAKVNPKTVDRLVRGDVTLVYFSTLSKLMQYFISQGLDINPGSFFRWQNSELSSNINTLVAQLGLTLDDVPTIAEQTGIPLLRLENLIRGNVKRVYLDDLARLLVFLEEREVSVEVGDLLRVEGSN